MGAESSKSGENVRFANLDASQVDKAKKELKRAAGGSTFNSQQAFLACMSSLGPLASEVFASQAEKGILSVLRVLQIADRINGDAADQSEQLLAIHGSVEKMLESVVGTFATQTGCRSTETLRDYLTNEAPSNKDLHRWLISSPLLSALVRFVYSPLWFGEAFPLLPHLSGRTALLEDSGAIAALNAHLPMERRKQWTPLFSSVVHGSSFSQLNKRVNGEGPCVVVVQTNDDKLFGCFASEGFVCGPQYRGDATCFLFELSPHLRIHAASGRSNNYAYLNCQQSSMPNGLGMGGYDDIWPFFLKEEYGEGISRANLTSFEKCCLAGTSSFEIKNIEVWRVGEKPKLSEEEEQQIRKEKSIIDKDPEARAILEMSGRKMHSEAYRDQEPILDD